jgi:SAM-dependent methyltransferase
MISHNKCPLCLSENIRQHLKTIDYFLSKEQFDLFKCCACGFVFTQDSPEENSIERYYASDEYFSHNDSATGFSSRLYRLSRSIMLKIKRETIKRFTGLKIGSLLDIGSGTGNFISVMKEAGWAVKGIEINKKAREYSVHAFDLEIISPEQISSLPAGSFDCITLWHVFEHFQDPFEYASIISKLLKPGGSCVVALPNSNSFDAGYYEEYWAAYDVPRHFWHFTPLTFKIFSEKSGFDIKYIRSLPLDVFYISSLSERYKGSRFSFFTGMIKGLCFAILSLFNKNKSSSLIYFLQRK